MSPLLFSSITQIQLQAYRTSLHAGVPFPLAQEPSRRSERLWAQLNRLDSRLIAKSNSHIVASQPPKFEGRSVYQLRPASSYRRRTGFGITSGNKRLSKLHDWAGWFPSDRPLKNNLSQEPFPHMQTRLPEFPAIFLGPFSGIAPCHETYIVLVVTRLIHRDDYDAAAADSLDRDRRNCHDPSVTVVTRSKMNRSDT